jgi:cold shock CspA family protein
LKAEPVLHTGPQGERFRGRIVFFDHQRGFGWIQPFGTDDKESRVFLHRSNIRGGSSAAETIRYPEGHDQVGFALRKSPKRPGSFEAYDITI